MSGAGYTVSLVSGVPVAQRASREIFAEREGVGKKTSKTVDLLPLGRTTCSQQSSNLAYIHSTDTTQLLSLLSLRPPACAQAAPSQARAPSDGYCKSTPARLTYLHPAACRLPLSIRSTHACTGAFFNSAQASRTTTPSASEYYSVSFSTISTATRASDTAQRIPKPNDNEAHVQRQVSIGFITSTSSRLRVLDQ